MKITKSKIFSTIAIIGVVLLLSEALNLYTKNQNKKVITAIEQEIQNSPKNENLNYVSKQLIVADSMKKGVFATPRSLTMPDTATISLYASGMNAPRFMAFHSSGDLFVTDINAGKVLLLKDSDSNGTAETILTVDQSLKKPHGIAYYKDNLYVAEENQVIVYKNIDVSGKFASKQVIVKNLPEGKGHASRTVIVGPDEKLYVSIGSSCNVCEENDKRRAAVVRYNLDGTGEEIFSEGLRNSVGIVFNQDKLWSVDNGRDKIGENIPPEEVNILEKGKNYGWPYCYGMKVQNPEFTDKETYCSNETETPAFQMQAHSAPLGMDFAPSTDIVPTPLQSKLLIGFHGSWNRDIPTGYKVVMLDTSKEGNKEEDLISGWLETNGFVWGRPVDVKFSSNGELFITDDQAGAVYRVAFSRQ
jgi:glucose/arabinose dehydrogenase